MSVHELKEFISDKIKRRHIVILFFPFDFVSAMFIPFSVILLCFYFFLTTCY